MIHAHVQDATMLLDGPVSRALERNSETAVFLTSYSVPFFDFRLLKDQWQRVRPRASELDLLRLFRNPIKPQPLPKGSAANTTKGETKMVVNSRSKTALENEAGVRESQRDRGQFLLKDDL